MNCEICGDELLTIEEQEAGVCNDCSCVVLHDVFEEEQLFGED